MGGKGELIYFKQPYSFYFHYILENYNAVRKNDMLRHFQYANRGHTSFSYLFPNPGVFWFVVLLGGSCVLIKKFQGSSETEN